MADPMYRDQALATRVLFQADGKSIHRVKTLLQCYACNSHLLSKLTLDSNEYEPTRLEVEKLERILLLFLATGELPKIAVATWH
jgi:hypothetical protein